MHYSFEAICTKIEMTDNPKYIEVEFIEDDEPFTLITSVDGAEASFNVGVNYEFNITKSDSQPYLTPLEEEGE